MSPKKSSSTTSPKKSLKKPKESPGDLLLLSLRKFLNDLECTREMFQIVLPVLQDQETKRTEKINAILRTAKASKEKSEDKKINLKVKDVKELIKNISKLDRATYIFRNNVIIGFVSRYDEFIGEITRNILIKNPKILNSQDKVLNYSEVLELGSVKKIRERFIEKEVDKIIRESHHKQLVLVGNMLGIPLTNNLPILPSFIELTERRNLFTHCGGTVSTQYLNVCKLHDVSVPDSVKEGEQLIADDDYIKNTFKILFEIGLKLGQTVYRKLYSDSLMDADDCLNEIGFDYLQEEDWEIADIAFDYGINLNEKWAADDSSRKYFIINKCIILSNTGKKGQSDKILDKIDWSSSNSKFLLAVHILKEDWDKAEKLMLKLGKDSPFEEDAYREWPLFLKFRKKKQFKNAFKSIYGKDFDSFPTGNEIKTVIKEESDGQLSN